jgi:exosortase H (IPTLxxWG-CTERM-specific)
MSESSPTTVAGWWRRPEARFLLAFTLLLAGGFAFLAWNPINDHLVEPFTAGVARASAALLNLLGQGVRQDGSMLRNDRFAVNVLNGCNGVETLVIFWSAVLAFPGATGRARLAGLLLGSVAIQAINLVRVAALFLTGAYLPRFFDSSHTVVWQTIVVLCGVLLWILWASRWVPRPRPAGAP